MNSNKSISKSSNLLSSTGNHVKNNKKKHFNKFICEYNFILSFNFYFIEQQKYECWVNIHSVVAAILRRLNISSLNKSEVFLYY